MSPDIPVMRGRPADYRETHPATAALVIEAPALLECGRVPFVQGELGDLFATA